MFKHWFIFLRSLYLTVFPIAACICAYKSRNLLEVKFHFFVSLLVKYFAQFFASFYIS